MGRPLKIMLLLFLLAIAAVGGAAGWHEYKSQQSWKAVAEQTAQNHKQRDALWREQLDALGRMRTVFGEIDKSYPKVAQAAKCPEVVHGDTQFFERRHMRELMQKDPEINMPDSPPFHFDDEHDFKHMENVPYWVIYTVEAEAAPVVNADHSLVPGSASGSVVIFDASSHRAVCQAPVSVRGSNEVKAMVRVRERLSGSVQLDNGQARLQDAANDDLMYNFQYGVGDALAQIAPTLKRPYIFVR